MSMIDLEPIEFNCGECGVPCVLVGRIQPRLCHACFDRLVKDNRPWVGSGVTCADLR